MSVVLKVKEGKMNIHQKYVSYCKKKSDINEHLPTLFKYAKECKHITEFGSRKFVSIWAFLKSNPDHLISYDIVQHKNLNEVKKQSELAEIEFTFYKQDVLDVTIEETDLLFIDTWHIYDQLIQELNIHSGNVRKYIILHDTTTFGEVGESKKSKKTYKGLNLAVNEFLDSNSNWRKKKFL